MSSCLETNENGNCILDLSRAFFVTKCLSSSILLNLMAIWGMPRCNDLLTYLANDVRSNH